MASAFVLTSFLNDSDSNDVNYIRSVHNKSCKKNSMDFNFIYTETGSIELRSWQKDHVKE